MKKAITKVQRPDSPRSKSAAPRSPKPPVDSVTIRRGRRADLAAVRRLTAASFLGVTLEQNVEQHLGRLNGRDWRWRKTRHVDEDFRHHPEGLFVAVARGRVVGYVTTVVDQESGRGRIPNLAVASAHRGHGLGRRLIEAALDSFRARKLAYAMIETMEQNQVGQHLYPACGFVEVARQVHYARRL